MQIDSSLVFIDIALRGVVVGLLALLALVLWKNRRPVPVVYIGLAVALGMVAHVVESAPLFRSGSPRFLEVALGAVANGNNPLFWFFALALFDDEFRSRPWQLAVWLGVVGFAAITLMTHDQSHSISPTSLHVVSHRILTWLPMLFGALTMAATFKHWRVDLIEQRRRLRAFIVIAGFVYMVGAGLARIAFGNGPLLTTFSMLDMIALCFIVFVIALRLLSLNSGALFPIEGSANEVDQGPGILVKVETQAGWTALGRSQGSTPEGTGRVATQSNQEEEQLSEVLLRLICENKVYREENLTIDRLAEKLQVPEYRLRRLINQRLGHRNFNVFLNTHRLGHVVAAMADSKRGLLPILTLALDAGFQSIGPFNRAFKLQFGMTPTEYRAKLRADFENG